MMSIGSGALFSLIGTMTLPGTSEQILPQITATEGDELEEATIEGELVKLNSTSIEGAGGNTEGGFVRVRVGVTDTGLLEGVRL